MRFQTPPKTFEIICTGPGDGPGDTPPPPPNISKLRKSHLVDTLQHLGIKVPSTRHNTSSRGAEGGGAQILHLFHERTVSKQALMFSGPLGEIVSDQDVFDVDEAPCCVQLITDGIKTDTGRTANDQLFSAVGQNPRALCLSEGFAGRMPREEGHKSLSIRLLRVFLDFDLKKPCQLALWNQP